MISGAAASPDEQPGSREDMGVTVGLGMGDGLAGKIPHALKSSRIKRCRRVEN
jgi:hypothetical protein